MNCTGAEKDVRECKHGGWHMSDCGHNEDAGVKCHHPHSQEPPVIHIYYKTSLHFVWTAFSIV